VAASRNVLVLVGPKGSGKTYIGSLVERELGVYFLRVEPIFLQNIRSSRLTGTALDEEGYLKVLAEMDSVLTREPGIIIESTGASDAFPAFLHALRSRYEVTLVSIRTPLERCLERVRSRDQTMHIPVSDDRVAEINERAAVVRLPWDLEIDNSGPASSDVIIDHVRRLLSRRPPRA
jgi:shikimate kinase